jgi:hypothetical protein
VIRFSSEIPDEHLRSKVPWKARPMSPAFLLPISLLTELEAKASEQ